MNPGSTGERMRLDKWLWAARFFKTRRLANEAVVGGKVHLDGQRSKPGKDIGPGARLRIRKGPLEWEVVVRATARQRRPAPEAVLLYEETPASRERRAAQLELRRDSAAERSTATGRPTKRDRRQLERMTDRGRR